MNLKYTIRVRVRVLVSSASDEPCVNMRNVPYQPPLDKTSAMCERANMSEPSPSRLREQEANIHGEENY